MSLRVRTVALAAAMLLPTVTFAQSSSSRYFGQGSRIASVGILTGGDYNGFGVGGSFEVGVKELTPTLSIGIGAFAGVVRDKVGYGFGTFGGEYTLTSIPVMGIGNVHLDIPSQPKLDLYAGVSAGIIASRFSYDDNLPTGYSASNNNSDFGIGIQVGARYDFAPRVSGMVQLGANDIPLLYAGLSFKM